MIRIETRRSMGRAASLVLGMAIVGIAVAIGVSVGAAEPDPDTKVEAGGWAYELPNYLMSPFCPGRTIADCSSPEAESLRLWMIIQQAAGRTRDDVESELIERYGDVVRPAPRATGIGVAAYAVPVVAFLAGGTFVVLYLRRQTHAPVAASSAADEFDESATLDPELERIIDEELARETGV